MLVRVQYRLAGLQTQSVDVSATSVWAAAHQVVTGINGGHQGANPPPNLEFIQADQVKIPEDTGRLFSGGKAPAAPKGA